MRASRRFHSTLIKSMLAFIARISFYMGWKWERDASRSLCLALIYPFYQSWDATVNYFIFWPYRVHTCTKGQISLVCNKCRYFHLSHSSWWIGIFIRAWSPCGVGSIRGICVYLLLAIKQFFPVNDIQSNSFFFDCMHSSDCSDSEIFPQFSSSSNFRH